MTLDLDETETAALVTLLKRAVDGELIDADLYPLSRRVMMLKEILGKLRPEPARPAASPRVVCATVTRAVSEAGLGEHPPSG